MHPVDRSIPLFAFLWGAEIGRVTFDHTKWQGYSLSSEFQPPHELK